MSAADAEPSSLPAARVAHRLPGRVRLAIAARRGNAAFFARAVAQLRTLPGVLAVAGNPVTGSLLIEHAGAGDPDGLAALAAAAAEAGLFRLATDGATMPPDKAPSSPLDLVSAGLAGLGLYQFGQGRPVGDAVENLWNGYGAAVTLQRPLVSAALVGIGVVSGPQRAAHGIRRVAALLRAERPAHGADWQSRAGGVTCGPRSDPICQQPGRPCVL